MRIWNMRRPLPPGPGITEPGSARTRRHGPNATTAPGRTSRAAWELPHPVPASTGTRLRVAAAVDDVRPGEVAHWCGEHVDEAAERPEREQRPGGKGVQPESDRRGEDQLCVRLQGKDRPEPR